MSTLKKLVSRKDKTTICVSLSRLCVLSVMMVCLLCAACSGPATTIAGEAERQQHAEKEALQFFKQHLKPDAELLAPWGLTNVRVFGHDQLLKWLLGMGASVAKTQNSPHIYEVTIPFWAKGKDSTAEAKRVSGAAIVELVVEEDDTVRITGSHLSDQEALPFRRQVLKWLLTSFLGPILLFLWWGASDAAAAFVSFLSLPLAAYGAFVCFGTVFAAFLGAAVYLALTRLVLRPILLSMLGNQ